MDHAHAAQPVPSDLSACSVEELVALQKSYPELSQSICKVLYNRVRSNERYRKEPWTQDAYDDLCRMLCALADVVDDYENGKWICNHEGLRDLLALAIMVVDPYSTLDARKKQGWIKQEHKTCRRQHELRKEKERQAKLKEAGIPRRKQQRAEARFRRIVS